MAKFVAFARGFLDGQLIDPGTVFHTDAKREDVRSFAAPAGQPAPEKRQVTNRYVPGVTPTGNRKAEVDPSGDATPEPKAKKEDIA